MKRICIILVMVLLGQLVENVEIQKQENKMVLEKNKISQIRFSLPSKEQSKEQSFKLWIVNNQQTVKIQVFNTSMQNSELMNQVEKYLPILSSHLNKKGYLKPLHPFSNQPVAIKGFKHTKASYHEEKDEVTDEVQAFLKALILSNQMGYLNLRIEDSFQIQLRVRKDSPCPVIENIDINYLFPTVDKETIPAQLLNIVEIEHKSQQKIDEEQISLERKISGKGLHQWVNHTLILSDKIDIQALKQKCYFQFADILPESTYIDSDQRRKETRNYQTINVQKPAFDSKQYFYSYRVRLSEFQESGVNGYLYRQPVHFRYPSPSLLNYTKVYLHPIEEARIICEQESVEDEKKSIIERVYKVRENSLVDRGTAKIPNADISKSKIVSIGSLAVCLVTALLILKNLKKF